MRSLLNVRDHRRDYTQFGVARIIRIPTLFIYCLSTYYRDNIVHIRSQRISPLSSISVRILVETLSPINRLQRSSPRPIQTSVMPILTMPSITYSTAAGSIKSTTACSLPSYSVQNPASRTTLPTVSISTVTIPVRRRNI